MFLFLFLPLFLLCYATLPRKNAVIVVFSLVFYFAGEGAFTLVVLFSLAINYSFGLLVDAQVERTRRLRAVLAGVSCNLLILVIFKYLGFFSGLAMGGGQPEWLKAIHMPIGISFFTFHSISYLVDVYRRKARAERSLADLGLYILMFPQLVAGPIIRYSTIAAQLRRRVVTLRHVYYACLLFAIGLGQKVLLADSFATIADPLFAQWTALSIEAAWIAAIAYTLQIFFDFGGYSNMAIGLGLICGFRFPRNFNYPYISQSVTEFWQRWHITLSRWFRDYLYIPLGGNRHGPVRTYVNLFTVFMLCGLWHGAAWTFIVWGAYHGCLLVVERAGFGDLLRRVPPMVRHSYALLAIMVGWVLFRANTLEQALGMLATMFGGKPSVDMPIAQFLSPAGAVALLTGVLFSTLLPLRLVGGWVGLRHGQERMPRRVTPGVYALGGLVALALFGASAVRILTGSYSPFIYFRF